MTQQRSAEEIAEKIIKDYRTIGYGEVVEAIKSYAAQEVAKEREDCAKLLESKWIEIPQDFGVEDLDLWVKSIRERKSHDPRA